MEQQKEIRDLLEDEIKSEIERLSRLNGEEKARAADTLVKLYKLNIEEIQNEREFMRQCEESTNQDIELKLKEAQLKEQIKARRLGIGVDAAKVIAPLAVFAFLTLIGYKFEEEGTMRSKTLQLVWNKFRPN